MDATEERVEKIFIASRDGARGPHKYPSTQLFQTSFLSKKLVVASWHLHYHDLLFWRTRRIWLLRERGSGQRLDFGVHRYTFGCVCVFQCLCACHWRFNQGPTSQLVKIRMSRPDTSQSSGTLPRDSERQRHRRFAIAVIKQEVNATPEQRREFHLILAIINEDIARTRAESRKTLHNNRESSEQAPSDSASPDDPQSAALAMGTLISRIFKFTGKVTGSDRFFRHDNLRNMRCAVKIDQESIMGNPFSPTPGWDLTVDLDPGVLTRPSIGLHFRFSKDGSDSKSNDYDNTFSLGWDACLKVKGSWMMEEFDVVKATTSLYPNVSNNMLPTAIQELCTKQEDLDRLYFAIFSSNVHKSSKMSPEWAKALQGDDWKAPYENLQRMCASGKHKYRVKIWFLNPHPTVEKLYHGCLAPLFNAVKDHEPQFRQYFHETARSVETLDCSEPSDDPDALRVENVRLKSDKSSLQYQLQDQTENIRNLADDLGQARSDSDALRAENLQLKSDNNSLQSQVQDQNEKIRKLADDFRQARSDPDTLRAESLQLKVDNDSLQAQLQDQNETIRKLTDELRQARKESDSIVQAAEGIKHHKDLKPSELQKALNAIAKLLR